MGSVNKMASVAYCTFLTNDDFLPGVLTVAQALKNHGTKYPLLAVATSEVTQSARHLMQLLDIQIHDAEVIDNNSTANLARINRPDLHASLTKFHIWTLTSFARIVYLDADTLPLANLDHLFLLPDSVEFAAASELGFPDCFNSGVMVLRPSQKVFGELVELAGREESLDGGDQGLLNVYFGDGSLGHPSRLDLEDAVAESEGREKPRRPEHDWYRLSYQYNCEMHRVYRMYIGAVLRYSDQAKILHFIGHDKPWRYKDGKVDLPEDEKAAYPLFYVEMINKWWDVWRQAQQKLAGLLSEEKGSATSFTMESFPAVAKASSSSQGRPIAS